MTPYETCPDCGQRVADGHELDCPRVDTVTCEEGHKHRVEDLDKVGMDSHCPECFSKVEVSG